VPHDEGYPSFGEGNEGLYRGEIAAADRYLGFVLDHLRAERAAWKKTLVVLVADHGEEFGEHGGTEHARTCHGESVHVPLLLRVPGSRARAGGEPGEPRRRRAHLGRARRPAPTRGGRARRSELVAPRPGAGARDPCVRRPAA
jgi:hypothetical protein